MTRPALIHNRPNPPGRIQSGFTLVELMVSITLGLLILAGLLSVFVSSNRSRNEIERISQQIENGRYAAQLISYDLRNAGYLAEFDPRPPNLPIPSAAPDVCAAAIADLKTALPLHVQGYDNGSTIPSCLSDVRSNTDILAIRRANTCVHGTADCDTDSGAKTYFQTSLCQDKCPTTELSTGNASDAYKLDTDTSTLTLHKRDGTTLANIYRYRTQIYFVANNDNGSDGIPTLKRAELGAGGFTIVPLVEGIENLQIEYGIDTSATKDGTPDVFTASPGSTANWSNVVSVRIYLLARNTQTSGGYIDSKTYTLGQTAAGAPNTFGPFNDGYRRHVYQVSVRLNNPAGRSSQ